MRLRWPKYLPRFPAILLVPAVLVAWAGACYFPHVDLESSYFGFPKPFYWHLQRADLSDFDVGPLVIDLTFAMATAYLVAFGVERFVFPAIRARQGRKRGTGEGG